MPFLPALVSTGPEIKIAVGVVGRLATLKEDQGGKL
jgi:hypothetical protein